MIDWLVQMAEESTLRLVFFSCFLFGLVFAVFSLIFGGDSDSDADTDGDFDTDGDGDAGGGGIFSGLFSIRGLSLFVGGFGGFGYLAHYLSNKALFSSAIGLASGLVFTLIVLAIYRVMIAQQASSLIKPAEMIGKMGVVTMTISPGSYGQVQLTVSGVEKIIPAIADKKLPVGTSVRIDRAGPPVHVVQLE